MKLLLLLAFTAVAVATPKGQITTIKDLNGKYNERIIGGSDARTGQFPWQVAVNYETSQSSYFCGGSLISNQWVLTAGHCAKGFQIQLQFGGLTLNDNEDGRVEVETSYSIVHPGFNAYLNNDIALIKLREPIQFTDRIRAIKLPRRGSHLGANEPVTISGWGRTSDLSGSISNTLKYTRLWTISNADCYEVYGQPTITNSTLCCKGAPYHSTCHGDSGGALITTDSNGEAIHVGVVSFVHSYGCGRGYPSGYARTESFLDWINQNTGIPV